MARKVLQGGRVKMKLERVIQYAQTLLRMSVADGDIAVDATAGNGHDTVFLAELVGPTGYVYAFDVQKEAVNSTLLRVLDHGYEDRVRVLNRGHEEVDQFIDQEIGGAIFNLGYLPGSDHSIVTKPNTTVEAIEKLLKQLKIGGIIVLVVYHGHVGGKEERDEVLRYVSELPQKYVHVLRYEFINQKNDPPFIIALEKVKQLPAK